MEILFLWVGLPFVAVGVLIVFSEVKSRRHATTAQGRVVGFSLEKQESGQDSYHTVAQFIGPDGRRRFVESVVGSSAPMGRPGGAITVVLHDNDPESATIQSSLLYVMGGVLTLLGAVSCTVFFATFRVSGFSIVTGLFVTLFGAWKLRLILLEKDLPFASWRETLEKALRARVFTEDQREQIKWADPALLTRTVRRQERANRFAGPVLFVAGAALLFLGFHLYGKTSLFLEQAARTTGHVVELDPSTTSDDVTYHPVVEFEQEGRTYRFRDSVGSNPPSHSVGDMVPVLFNPTNPQEGRIDHGIWNLLLPLLLGAAGVLMALSGAWIAMRRRSAPMAGETDVSRAA